MQPLIDADVLLYEVGFGVETGWEGPDPPPFDKAAELLHMKVDNLCAIINATEKPIFFMTGSSNFRHEIAKSQPYKQRPGARPFHYKNLKAYMKAVYDVRIQEGLEADDLMAIEQTKRPAETIICTIDKDLAQVPGWYYRWETHNAPSFGPFKIENPGLIELETKINSKEQKSYKIRGYGDLFFYAQCLLGDPVDTVRGLGGRTGPVKAFEILFGSEGSLDAFNRVLEAYRGLYGDKAEEELLEQGRLLYMTRELNEDGSPKLWEFPNGIREEVRISS